MHLSLNGLYHILCPKVSAWVLTILIPFHANNQSKMDWRVSAAIPVVFARKVLLKQVLMTPRDTRDPVHGVPKRLI